MNDKINYLYHNKEITDILAEGLAKICQEKPKFPINYLARYLKSHTLKNQQKTTLIDRIQSNHKITNKLLEQQKKLQVELFKQLEIQKVKVVQKDQFLTKISTTERHEQILDFFCQWINQRLKLAGVYIGELEHQVKKININQEDAQEAHLQLEKQKIIKFKYSSEEQKKVVIGRTLTQESVVGKLLNQPQTNEPQADQQGEENNEAKKSQVRGEIYIPSVVGHQNLKFFRFPKLGSYFATILTIKSYLKQKLFDQNTVKIQNYKKVLHEYEKQIEEKQTKFKEAYDERVNAGAEEKELQIMEKQFQLDKSQIKKPLQEDFSFSERKFVVCADTLGLDRQITQKQKIEIRELILHLKTSWESQQKNQLEKDIQLQLSLSRGNSEEGQDVQVQNFQEQLTNLLDEEERDIPSHEEVEKVKDNEKLLQLESNTVRIQKTKEYMTEEKNLRFWDRLLDLNVVKYQQVIKQFLIFLGYRKEEFCFTGSNVLDWKKTKHLMKTQQASIFQRINTINPRGSRPQIVQPYAKCSRIQKNLQGLEPSLLANYNIYLAFMLRLVQLYTKTRVQDREARLAKIHAERELRQQKIKEIEQKASERKEKLDALKADLQEKGELGAFDEQAWSQQYDQENPPIQIPNEVPDDIDRDLQDVLVGEKGQRVQKGDE